MLSLILIIVLIFFWWLSAILMLAAAIDNKDKNGKHNEIYYDKDFIEESLDKYGH